MELLMKKINSAPQQPGCYLYKNNLGHIIYVGKSKNLHSRVRQYFQPSTVMDNSKLQGLVRSIADVEYRITDTELNALILEYKLIKQYKPWFNSQFKRDLEHPLIRISIEDEFPAFSIVYEKISVKSEYIDCFSTEEKAIEAIELMNAIWKTPACKKKAFEKPERPCTRYHINKCLAPCAHEVDSCIYKETIKELICFLNGKKTNVLSRLYKEMNDYAENLNFEKALKMKNSIDTLIYLQRKNKWMFHFPSKRNVLFFIRAYRSADFSVFYIKSGVVLGRADFLDEFDQEVVSQFIIDIQTNKQAIIEEGLLGCLTEIVADKMFIVLPIKSNKEMIEKKLMKGYLDFNNQS